MYFCPIFFVGSRVELNFAQSALTGLRVLTVCPTTSHPPMIGDAKRIHRLSRALQQIGVSNLYVGKNFIYRGDEAVQQIRYQMYREWPRTFTGLMAFAKRGHYNEVKHCTQRWLKFVEPYLRDEQYNVIYSHFVFTYPLIASMIGKRLLVVDTHNSEWEWYAAFRNATHNRLVKKVCDYSAKRISQIMLQLPPQTIMAHVSESDAEAYRCRRPDLRHILVPNGGDVNPRQELPDYGQSKKQLLFFASLHGKMSFDALQHFSKAFWPLLSGRCEMVVAGANPSPAVMALCAQHGWCLKANLSEPEVESVFREAHFSVMPFFYGAGSKLKFFDAVTRGVPVLSTRAGACGQTDKLPTFVTVSDDPQVWQDVVKRTQALDPHWRQQVIEFGEQFGWPAIAGNLAHVLAEELFAGRQPVPQFTTEAKFANSPRLELP
jgi:hypothetical protein